ncbi:hypothetical protein BGZ91_007928, partial [Linnemannia elongata]
MSDHPPDQLDPLTIGCNSANNTARTRKRDKFFESLGFSKSKSKEVKPKASNQSLHPPPASQQLTRPPTIAFQASSHPSGDSQSIPSSTTKRKVFSASLIEAHFLEDIFGEDTPRPTMKTELPQPQQRIEMTHQLVYCNALLLRDTLSLSKAAPGEDADSSSPLVLQEPAFDNAELDWLETTKKDPMEADHLRWLATRVVEQFVADENKTSTKIAEVIALGRILEKEHYRKLLATFIKEFVDARILDVDILQGLVQLVQDASPGYLVSDDLVKILGTLRVCLEGTHQQSIEHSYHLTLAVSRILDVMADHRVKDLDRVLEHEPLSDVLSGLKGTSDPYLLYQACYAYQALQSVPNDETALGAMFRHTIGVADGLTKVSAVITLDLMSALEGLGRLQEALDKTVEVVGSVYEVFCLLMESGRGVFDSLKEAFGSGQRHPWYLAVKQAVILLGHLYKNDQDWGWDESVEAWMLTIITKLCASSEEAVSETARSVLQDLTVEQSTLIKHPYPLTARLLFPSASPLLAKVQNIQYPEYELHKFLSQRLNMAKMPIYISPMAKASLQARDNELFPLKEKVQEFLA